MTDLTGVLILATIAEAIVEYFVAPLLDKVGKQYVRYSAAGVGVLLCMAYQVDILNMLAGITPIHPAVGWALSGIIIGRGSNFLNDLISSVRGGARSLSEGGQAKRLPN